MYWQGIGPQRFKFHSIIHFCGDYFYKTHIESIVYKDLHAQHIKKLINFTLVMLFLMLMAYAIFFIIPIYLSYYQHVHVTPVATNLPFFEKDSLTEYIVNMIVQLILSFVSMCGSYAILIASCAIIHAIMIVPDSVQFSLLEFQDEWEVNGITSTLLAQLRNSFVQLQDFQRYGTNKIDIFGCAINTFNIRLHILGRYLLDVIDVFGNKLFICPFAWAFSMSLSIFAALVIILINMH